MSNLRFITAAFALSAGALIGATSGNNVPRVPVLLELFTSEGCSSCPPADRLLATLDQTQPVPGADLIVLSEHVDYWNRLGWTDPFSSALYSARQQEYSERLRGEGVYTPQLVVDGQFGFVGSYERAASSAIRKTIREPKIPIAISAAARSGDQVTARLELPAAKGARGILYVALAENRTESHVASGENAGRSLTHIGVARVLKQVATVDLAKPFAADVKLAVLPGEGADGWKLVTFLQDSQTGRVLALAAQKL
jgi:hypothetical protein